MVKIEEHLSSIDERLKATQELFLDERKARRAAEEEWAKHMAQDDQRFSSIDSRLMGMQDQLSTSNQTMQRIESMIKEELSMLKERVGFLEITEGNRTAIQRFLGSTYTHVAVGVGMASALFGVAVALMG